MTDAPGVDGGDAACWLHEFAPDGPPDVRSRADLEAFVRAFYAAALADDLLGPIFAADVADWDRHVERITDFWAWQVLGGAERSVNPLRAHVPVHERHTLTAAHHARWLALFDATLAERHAGPVADRLRERARRMSAALAKLLDGPAVRLVPPLPTPPA